MTKTGRPRTIEINWDMFDKLCELQCTEREIAGFFGCSVDTLNSRCKEEYGQTFSELFAQKRKAGHISLRRWQWQSAEKGNTAMLIFLGKQYLGQSDKPAVESEETRMPLVIVRHDKEPELSKMN